MNDKPCGECQHFDVIIRGKRETKHGWCAKKSKYPAKEGPGQVFPEGVERVGNGELAQPVIVGVAEVASRCANHRARNSGVTKRDLVKKLQTQGGKVLLS